MQTLTEIRRLLDERGLRPNKKLGQNFLIDQNLIGRLIEAAGVGDGDLVLEIGPGTGTLTEALLERGCEVVACELDRGLGELLDERLGSNDRFTLVRGDCLESKRTLNPELVHAVGSRPFSLVANLPYGAGTPALLALLIDHPACARMAVTVQREVAERLSASPGTRAYGTISVIAQALCRVERIANLPPECFWPRPDVTSAMVLLERLGEASADDPRGLAEFCQRVFSARRKQLGSVLGRDFPFPEGVSPTDRAESLPVGVLIALARGGAAR